MHPFLSVCLIWNCWPIQVQINVKLSQSRHRTLKLERSQNRNTDHIVPRNEAKKKAAIDLEENQIEWLCNYLKGYSLRARKEYCTTCSSGSSEDNDQNTYLFCYAKSKLVRLPTLRFLRTVQEASFKLGTVDCCKIWIFIMPSEI